MAELDAGTVYANRCDYLDPLLPWVGGQGQRQGLLALPPGLSPPDVAEELPPATRPAGLTGGRRAGHRCQARARGQARDRPSRRVRACSAHIALAYARLFWSAWNWSPAEAPSTAR